MELMADARARRGKHHAVAFRERAQKTVVIGIAEARLQGVVIRIAHGKPRAHPVDVHGFKLETGHRARRVLGQGLIHAHSDFGAGAHCA
jgi:hypothetical protein